MSESWRHRLLKISGGDANPLLSDLPGYTSRIVPGAGGGYWLYVFAPRSQLIELVPIEKDFRERMLREFAPAEALGSADAGAGAKFPRTNAGRRAANAWHNQAVVANPFLWARGQVGRAFSPCGKLSTAARTASIHGVTSCLDLGDRIPAASQGGNAILSLRLSTGAPQ